jgi:hypothetical protein
MQRRGHKKFVVDIPCSAAVRTSLGGHFRQLCRLTSAGRMESRPVPEGWTFPVALQVKGVGNDLGSPQSVARWKFLVRISVKIGLKTAVLPLKIRAPMFDRASRLRPLTVTP